MNAVDDANRRLAELGYAADEARAQQADDGVRVSGSLLAETEIEARDLYPVLAMLPPKYRLVIFRHVLASLPTVERKPAAEDGGGADAR
jgi:hypothetical protein